MSTRKNQQIELLLKKRNELRERKQFAEADAIRDQLSGLGIVVEDTETATRIITSVIPPSFLVIFGSGEISSVGRQIHEHVFKQIAKPEISVVIVSTPAGFQPNVEIVHEEIAAFFREHLTNFHPRVEIIYANTQDDANDPRLLVPLQTADYIFVGPGSPTYAVNNLRDTLLLKTVFERVANGASVCLASAAAIAFSHFALPVYEIYKVGEKLRWEKGLDGYQTLLGKRMTIVPHHNNNEGGEKNDTSYCFMGKKRFGLLRNLLPKTEKIIGVDENTAVVWNLTEKTDKILGKGTIHTL